MANGQWAAQSAEYRAQRRAQCRAQCRVRVRSPKSGVSNLDCGIWSAGSQFRVPRAKCQVQSMECKVSNQIARHGLGGWEWE